MTEYLPPGVHDECEETIKRLREENERLREALRVYEDALPILVRLVNAQDEDLMEPLKVNAVPGDTIKIQVDTWQ